MARGKQLGVALGRAMLGLTLAGSACAHAAGPEAPAVAAQAELGQELSLLRNELEERTQRINQLESRLSLLEAEQRQLRYSLAERESTPAPPPREARAAEQEARPARREAARPVLRLYSDRRGPEVALEPVPQVHERLPVAPLPAGLGMAEPQPLPESASEPDRYLAAIDLVRRRDFDAALAQLDAFLAQQPHDARVTRALFWRGEVLFAQKRYVPALSAFQTALEREPRGEKAADALFKIGLCHKRLGAPDRARAAFEQLKAQFPDSHAARLARAEET